MQIGPLTSTDRKTECYQLAQPDQRHHIEPLPLDEFGYLFPPLKPEPKLAATNLSAPALAPLPKPVEPLPAVAPLPAAPPTAPAPIASAPRYITKAVRFSTHMPFRINGAHLSRKNRTALSAFVNSLEQYRGVESIRVTGHTDKSGPARFNKWLSGMRAKSTQLWLLSLGVDPRTIHIHGVGSSEPLPHAHNAADNRYVDIEVIVRTPAN